MPRSGRDSRMAPRSTPSWLERVPRSGRQVHERTAPYERLLWAPAPYYSVLMTGALEAGVDHGAGARYRNLGIHGAAAASAADALSAVRRHVFELADVDRAELLVALEADFVGHEALRWRLAEESPRVGLNEPAADDLVRSLYDRLADACEQEHPQSGAIVRPGTGVRDVLPLACAGTRTMGRSRSPWWGRPPMGAGRGPVRGQSRPHAGDSRARTDQASCSPTPGSTTGASATGVRSRWSYPPRSSPTPESIRKVALLVRTFAPPRLPAAAAQCPQCGAAPGRQGTSGGAPRPDRSVWGWKGYFCELAPEYQDHVISRHLYADV